MQHCQVLYKLYSNLKRYTDYKPQHRQALYKLYIVVKRYKNYKPSITMVWSPRTSGGENNTTSPYVNEQSGTLLKACLHVAVTNSAVKRNIYYNALPSAVLISAVKRYIN